MLATVAQPEDLFRIVRDVRDAAVVSLMAQAITPGEIEQLDVDDVDLVAGQLQVHGGGHGRPRRVTLTAATIQYLAPYLRARPGRSGALFLTRDGRLAVRTIRAIARRQGANGAELRRRFIRTSLDDGADPRALRQELGLTSIDPLYRALDFHPLPPQLVHRKAAAGAVVAMPARSAWDAEPLRQWTLQLLERQCESWNLSGLQLVPPGFHWPPLPPSDIAKLRAAEGKVVEALNVLLEQLMT